MGDFVIFSYFFRISGLEGFSYSVAPQGDLNSFVLCASPTDGSLVAIDPVDHAIGLCL